jgi:hypothetical protein
MWLSPAAFPAGQMVEVPMSTEREMLLEEALMAIRGVVLGPLTGRDALILINEIVGEALYGDFAGIQLAAYDDGRILR